MLTEPITFENPKNGDKIESRFEPDEVIEILSGLTRNNFAQSLVENHKQWGLSPAQWYWAHKLAHENNPHKKSQRQPGELVVPLSSNLHEWLLQSGRKRIMWKYEDLENNSFPRMRLYIREDAIDVVYSGGDYTRRIGKIVGDKFFTSSNCPKMAIAQLVVFSQHKKEFMVAYGKKFGVCFVCGAELTDEKSVAAGIGPICANRF